MNNKGVTLIELVIVISIIGVLIIAAGFSFAGWMSSYKIESGIKEMYVDFMNARARAMDRNRTHFVKPESSKYTIYEDTDPQPDGNNTLEETRDTRLLQKDSEYTIEPHIGTHTKFYFDKNGLSSLNGHIIIKAATNSNANPDYDCIVLYRTRINIGKWNGKSGDESKCNAL